MEDRDDGQGRQDVLAVLAETLQQGSRGRLIPENLDTIAGTWGAIYDTGELTYLNLVHLAGCDGTDPDDLTQFEIEGRKQAMLAVDALRALQPGLRTARLRNFGMTLGVRDTRKIDAVYNMTSADVREQARFDDSVGIFPEFIDGYGMLILPTTGRYFQVPYTERCWSKRSTTCWSPGRATGGDRDSHAATRNMMCCTVTGQGAGVAAAVSSQARARFFQISSIDACARPSCIARECG